MTNPFNSALSDLAAASGPVEGFDITPPTADDCGGDMIEWLRRMAEFVETPDGKRWADAKAAAMERERIVQQSAELESQRARWVADARAISARYQGKAFGTFKVRGRTTQAERAKQLALEAMERWTACVVGDSPWKGEPRQMVSLMGPVGTGKTHLAVAAVVRIVERTGWSHAIWTVGDLLTAANPFSYGDKREDRGKAAQVIRHAQRCGVLLVDDMGSRTSALTDRQMGHLFDIVNERVERRLPTLFTTNLGSLAASLGAADDADPTAVARIVSRLSSTVPVAVGGRWDAERGEWRQVIPDQRRAA